jgi:Zn-dependent alcohol dehydrogenases
MKVTLLYKTAKIETNHLNLEKIEIPKVAEDEVLIRIKACGVCKSNLNMIEGDWEDLGVPSKFPIFPGHEIVGIVEKVGKNVSWINEGERVGVQSLYKTCGKFEYRLSRRENLCLEAEITGATVDSGYAEYMKANTYHVYKVPDNLKDEEVAPLFCPGVTAYRAVKLAEVSFGKKVAIFGIGGVAHLAFNIKDFKFSNEQIIKGSVIGIRIDMKKVLEIASKGLN